MFRLTISCSPTVGVMVLPSGLGALGSGGGTAIKNRFGEKCRLLLICYNLLITNIKQSLELARKIKCISPRV